MMKALTLLFVVLVSVHGVAGAESLAFDFDVDDDPATIDPEVTAALDEIVLAYLVVNDIPGDYRYVHGFQLGLDLSEGLELRGMSIVGLQGGMGNDGTTDGIVVTLAEPIPAAEFPSFVMRFALKVTQATTQTAAVAPSTGWGTTYDGFVYLVSNTGDAGDEVTVEDVQAIQEQTIARVNIAPTPVEVISWGALKMHF